MQKEETDNYLLVTNADIDKGLIEMLEALSDTHYIVDLKMTATEKCHVLLKKRESAKKVGTFKKRMFGRQPKDEAEEVSQADPQP